jgi:prolipoprotein diacylglyceryl transferase
MLPLSIPSPSKGVVHLGPLPIRGYALCIIAGIVVAVWLSERRWQTRGGRAGQIQDIALWAVPFGVVGGRLYHVITDHDLYFGAGRHPIDALYVWRGGLGIWGAIALGVVGGIIGAKRMGIRVAPLLDVALPTCLIAQGMGRWGNWFNQELYGRPTKLPWGLEIDPSHWPAGRTFPIGTTFHPTFLYEFLWCVAGYFFVIWMERRFRLGHGRVAALYVMTYTVGRFWIERLRIDTIELNNVLGMRWADWMAIILFVLAAAYFVWATINRPGREQSLYAEGRQPADEPGTTAEA